MKIIYTTEKVVAEMSHQEAIRIASVMCKTVGPAPLVIMCVRALTEETISQDIRNNLNLCFPVELHFAEKQYMKDNNLTPEVLYESQQ